MRLKKRLRKILKNKKRLLVFILLAFGVFLRLYNLNWGAPYFFHPDERNIASSVSQLVFPDEMNPRFFAYGTLPIYFIYLTGVINNLVQSLIFNLDTNIWKVAFEDAIIIGRAISASLSILTLYLIFIIGKNVGGFKTGILSTLLAAFSTGLIQYSHFMTFEMWLTFFTLLLFNFTLQLLKKFSFTYIVYLGFITGVLVSVKITSLIFVPVICIIIIFKITQANWGKKINIYKLLREVLKLFIFLGIISLVVAITCQYYWLDRSSFMNSINYESAVATGKLSVFYSQTFNGSIPGIYPIFKVYPFIANPFLLAAFLILFPIYLALLLSKFKYSYLILLLSFLITFIPQTLLFVKWTRYYIPTLPFMYLMISISLLNLKIFHYKVSHKLIYFVIILLITSSLIFSFSYFKTALLDKDTRVSASNWAKDNLQENSRIISEIYDMGIVPFNSHFPDIKLFNFYELENDPQKPTELTQALRDANYIILPSQRILESRISHSKLYPVGTSFYQGLLKNDDSNLVYKTPCDLFCKILYLGDPLFTFEQTANVFDRPEVRIYRNDKIKE